MPSKKHALAQGIAASKGEILMFTDADCLPLLLGSHARSGIRENVGLVAGYSPTLEPLSATARPSFMANLLRNFIQYEEFQRRDMVSGLHWLDRGWLCTGRSLAYRRAVYEEVGGFENIKHSVSGDDDLFLQMVRRNTSGKYDMSTSPGSFVPTYPPPTFGAFVRQRTRHFLLPGNTSLSP